MEEENGSGYNDNSNVGCLFWINVLFNDQTTEEKRRRIKTDDGNSGSWRQRVDNKRILRSCCR